MFGGLDISPGLIALGAITGMTYGILAVGLMLVYRSSGMINFAHGEIGAFGAAVCGLLAARWDVPFWLAFAAALVVGAAVGATTELVVVRRLRGAPKLMSLVATLGVAQFLLTYSVVVNNSARAANVFPQPPGLPRFRIGSLLVTPSYVAMLVLSPVLVIGIAAFLRRSRFGLAMRAAAANNDRARLLGISAPLMSTMAWAIAGGVAAFTTVLLIPTRGFVSSETLGPSLLLRALAPAVIARMANLPVALAAGIGLGVIDQVLTYNSPTSGASEVVLFGVIGVALLLQTRQGGRVDTREDWARLQPWRPMPDRLQSVWAIRNLGWILAAGGLALGVAVGITVSNADAVILVSIIAFALLGLSVGVVTGLSGQLSLGQFAIAGVGGAVSYLVSERMDNLAVGLACGALAAALSSALLGVPALRVRGVLLGVVTLSFALVAQRWLLSRRWMLGDGVIPSRGLMGIDLVRTRQYYFWALGVLVVGFFIARNVWRGDVGLRLRAVRDSEDVARAFGISATVVKLQGFAIAGALAGLAGAVYAHVFTRVSAQTFDVGASISAVAIAVIGGIGMLSGPLLGAFYIIGLPRFLPLDNAGMAASALGWLLLILYFPGGLAQIVAMPRRHLVGWLARRHGVADAEQPAAAIDAALTPVRLSSLGPGLAREDAAALPQTVLAATSLVKRYGGVRAVNEVSVSVRRGELLGLIGPNGAGKTTLFELLSGFTTPDAGHVELLGEDVTSRPPEQRAHRGLIRSFQDAAMFPTLSVLETVTLAHERTMQTNVVASLAGVHRLARRKADAARELIGLMGLEPHRDKLISELSTGTRRMVDLACVVAMRPRVLLLDEPSSGIAQRESEALGGLLLTLREELGCTMIVIEHDIPLLMSISDRVVAMDLGRIVAVGPPADVRAHPHVVASYLGSDRAAIERSDLRHATTVTS